VDVCIGILASRVSGCLLDLSCNHRADNRPGSQQQWGQQITRISCTFVQPYNLRFFPFDVQVLNMSISFEVDSEHIPWQLAPDLGRPLISLDRSFINLAEFVCH
jgi:hypothetical protein